MLLELLEIHDCGVCVFRRLICRIGQVCYMCRRRWRAAKYDCRVVELVAVLCAFQGRPTEFSAFSCSKSQPRRLPHNLQRLLANSCKSAMRSKYRFITVIRSVSIVSLKIVLPRIRNMMPPLLGVRVILIETQSTPCTINYTNNTCYEIIGY